MTHRLETDPITTSGGAQVVTLDSGASQNVLDVFRGRANSTSGKPVTEAPITPQMVTVDVMNTTDTAGLARKAADELVAGGFQIGVVDNAPSVDETVIRYAAGSERQAKLLASKITPSPKVRKDATLAAGKVELDLAGTLGSVAAAPPPTQPGAAGSAGGSGTTSVNTPEPTVGVSIGDPPAGIRCG